VHDVGSLGPLAPLWRRLAARVADSLTVFFVVWALVVTGAFWFVDDLSDTISPEPWGRAFVVTALYSVLAGIYEVIYLRWDRGQTPGKDFFKVRVVRADGGGELAFGQVVARWVLPGAVRVLPPVWLGTAAVLATAITIPFDRRRRTLHDLVAGTVVVFYDRSRETQHPDDHGSDGEGLR
jgi:uncharacterized RDD family membrane protein YckC